MKVVLANFPSGSVIQFAGTTAPAGWLLCDGTTYSRALYPALFSAIGTAWGNGDGSTTFHTPDMRGRFPRGLDNSAGRDPDRASRTASNAGGNTGDNVGTVQADNFKTHLHALTFYQDSGSGGAPNNPVHGTATTNGLSKNQSSTGGNETRPQNANFNYIIKV